MREIKLVDNPEVSIIVPVFNGERFIAQTLDSLVKQEFPNIEIIIVNDGSTDNSKKIVDHFSFDRRLRYIEKPNGGTGSALNAGHEIARGKYLTWCSADNIYFPNFISTLYGTLRAANSSGGNIGLVYSDFCFMTEDGRKIRDVVHTRPQRGVDLIEGYDVGMSFLYTKELWDATGPYWEKICEDFHWCVRAAQHTNFGLVNAVLAAFRVHGAQITGSRQEEEKAIADECKALARKLFADQGTPEHTLAS
jgi:glycosyltransferase involved in cell wall biosynthesis